STIRLCFHLKSDDIINERKKNTNKNDMQKPIDEIKRENLEQIRLCLKQFLDFFYENSINVCFGSIAYRRVTSSTNIYYHRFSTFVQQYSWLMLINVGFRLEQQIKLSKTFIEDLKHIANDKNYSDDFLDDRFYRICIYLWRRSSEYFFLGKSSKTKACNSRPY
ncbi:unnamed protein product, partial [Didymodactylos carnosus]